MGKIQIFRDMYGGRKAERFSIAVYKSADTGDMFSGCKAEWHSITVGEKPNTGDLYGSSTGEWYGMALQWVKEQTPELYMVAVKQNPEASQWVKE